MPNRLEEAQIRTARQEGGVVVGAFIVVRGNADYVVYLRPSWTRGRGFRIITTWRGQQGDKVWKSFDVAMRWIRKHAFSGRVTIYPVGDPELRTFLGVQPQDLGESPD